MKTRDCLLAAMVTSAMGLGLIGCDAGEPSDASESADVADGSESPESRARSNSDEGAAALAESDKGVDEDGEKTWKQDAREYYDFKKNPKNRTFEMPIEWARTLTANAYAAGATNVWVTRITATDIADTTIYMSDDLLIVLPDDPAKRKAVFDVYNAAVEDEELKFTDVGQKYIHIVAD